MNVNRNKINVLYKDKIDGDVLEFGYLISGRAFVARNGNMLSKIEAVAFAKAPAYYTKLPLKALVGSWLFPRYYDRKTNETI